MNCPLAARDRAIHSLSIPWPEGNCAPRATSGVPRASYWCNGKRDLGLAGTADGGVVPVLSCISTPLRNS